MGSKKGKAKKNNSTKSYSGIAAHKVEKKVLVPPLMAVPGIKLQSWMNDRMPEMLWSALLISRLGRDNALERFRQVAQLVTKLRPENRTVQPTLSGLATLNDETLGQFIAAICSDTEARNALRPLLLFDELPARAQWATNIGQVPTLEDWQYVKAAVLPLLDHQSQEATDCRWLKVLFRILSGHLCLQTEEQVREILEYPNFGLQQKVRPLIRSMEGLPNDSPKAAVSWPQSFWQQCLRDTDCDPRHTLDAASLPIITTTSHRVRDVREALARHQKSTLSTTDVDPRHDATFGFAAYALGILDELIGMGNSISILGRVGLRTLLECYVTLLHLKRQDDPTLWMAYRQYGSGQAKLAFLKLDDSTVTTPSSVNPELLRQLANEDRWLEFVSIGLGHWASSDLRKLSEDLGIKPEYDRLYPWTSAFTHGNWAALRNSCFDLCVNPLHRLHRRLRSDTGSLGDVVPDACELVDKILDVIDSLYPSFAHRVTIPQSKTAVAGATVSGPEAPQSVALASIQREFLQILDEFFRLATGSSAEEFAALDSFGETIRAQAERIGPLAPQAFLYVHEALEFFYKRFGVHLYAAAKQLSGLKLVLGGTSHLRKSQFDSVRRMLLYADSILIPDPILPWIESPRAEERFRNVRLLEAAFFLLHYKPVVDADLPFMPIVIVPSFEKSLEEHDTTTHSRIDALIARVLSHFLGMQFDTVQELQEFVTAHEAEFMRRVDEHKLFIAPGGQVGQPLEDALNQYEAEIRQWRTRSYRMNMEGLPRGILLLNGMTERLAPHYHLLENAEELSSCPLIPLRAPWHYYTLISKFFASRLQKAGNLDAATIAAFDQLEGSQERFLGDIPLSRVVELLHNHENTSFRLRFRDLVSILREAPVDDLNRVAADVCRGIAALLKEHDADIRAIQEKYKPRYGESGVTRYLRAAPKYALTLAPRIRVEDPPKINAQAAEHQKATETADGSARSLLGIFPSPDAS